MAKKRSWFPLGMVLYALVFLGGVSWGLTQLWDFLEAYEVSRPGHAVQAYMDSLTQEHILEKSRELIDSIDHNLQSPESCQEVLRQALSAGVRHTKKSRECTDTRLVYMLQTGSQVVGSFVLETGTPDAYGFSEWTLKEESFDLSYLLGEPVTVIAPDVCSVSVNGTVLDERYVTGTVPYEALEEYYEGNALPVQLTYEIPALLGEAEVTIADPKGEAVTFGEDTDWSVYYNNCTQEETQSLERFVKSFVRRYVEFTGSNKDTREEAYKALTPYLRGGSDLALRIKNAVDGLQFGQSIYDVIVSLDIRPQVRMENSFLVDITYEVDTTGKAGVVRTTTNARLLIVQKGGMWVETLQFY